VEPGQTIALVGKSGGGKSTLVKLLPRFYEVNQGEILLDGHNIQEYPLKDLRRQIAVCHNMSHYLTIRSLIILPMDVLLKHHAIA